MIFIDGYEQFESAPVVGDQLRKAGYSTSGNLTTLGRGRDNKGIALYLSRTSVDRVVYTEEQPIISCGMSIKFEQRGGMFIFGGVEVIVDCVSGHPSCPSKDAVPTDFAPKDYIGGSAIPVSEEFYYYEAEINKTEKTFTMWLNGRLQFVAPLPPERIADAHVSLTLNPWQTRRSGHTDVKFTQEVYSTNVFDDVYIKTGHRLGPLKVFTRFPDANVTNTWQKHGGREPVTYKDEKGVDQFKLDENRQIVYRDLEHWEVVGKRPANELARYLMTDQNGTQEIFTSSTEVPSDGPTLVVGLIALVMKTDQDDSAIEFKLGDYTKRVDDIATKWAYRYVTWEPVEADRKGLPVTTQFGLISRMNR